ncbi:fibroblast growth factor receptor 4-like [Branchiostoma floridae]|uniref:Fibroblast growth factor receptor 4-like n=1 Tax=Branchiostoma floridae TaxID=7739 RepID=A0A9J7N0J8_BRAFL|nr:fibroblast growth factor receptor 4-like [Branchiostoma floridae]
MASKDICCDGTISIQNGKVTDTNGYCSGNEKIQFSCDPGYELAGKPSATCLKNGSWDAETPTCQRSCCNNTISITNGHITASNGYCSGNSIHFSCDVGYKLVGSSSAICQVDKHWDREIPTCQRICCDNTTEIINGLVNATDGYCFGNDMQFSCNPGYELVGRSLATCEDDGSWGREFPICRPHTVPTEQSLAFTQAIIGGTSAGITTALIVAAVFFMVFLRQRRRKRREDYQQPIELDFLPDDVAIHRRRMEEMVQLVPPRPQFPKLEVDPSRVTLGQRIGSGAFGLVYRAILTRDDRTEDVVVKTVKENASEDDKLSFLEEIRAVVDLGAHKNLLGLVNCCTVVRDHLYLITEFMPYGDLKSFLRKCREEENSDGPRDDIYNFEVMQMFQVARQIAGGMDHIARSRYVHGDLAARNVLVGERLKVKISDFGLAENIYQRGYRRQDRLQKVPVKWMAPERLQGGEAYTTQSDVWSYGIVLYEICTLGDHPYPDVAVNDLKDRLQAGYRMPQPEDCPDAMYDLMLQCWRWQPVLRPSFRTLEAKIDRNLAFYGPEYARPAQP